MEYPWQSAASDLTLRIENKKARGVTASKEDVIRLQVKLGLEVPDWFCDLLTKFPLGAIELGIKDGPEEDNISWMQWSTIDGILSESVDCYPGTAVLKSRWINVASCSLGSGDPYFVPLDQGEDPPIYRVFHELCSDDGYENVQGCQCERLNDSLSSFFQSVII